MQLLRYLHAALLVSNLERSEQFYGTVLGLSKVDRVLKFPGVWYQLGEFQIHLIEDKTFATRPHNSEKWGRNSHLAFAVDDLQAAKERLLAHGYEIQMSASGRTALFIQDPDGNIIEIGELA